MKKENTKKIKTKSKLLKFEKNNSREMEKNSKIPMIYFKEDVA